jgi:SAM-dependent methyltransferase
MSGVAAAASAAASERDLLDLPADTDGDYLQRNKAAWERWATAHIAPGRMLWQADNLGWGLWGTPESDLGLLSSFGPGADVLELGCGTGAITAWLARIGMRPVGVDIARAQLRTAEALQDEFGVSFDLLEANAEQVPFDHQSFDLVVSEYGASLWCDPRKWVPEASRLLRPEGVLVFFTNGAQLLTCTPIDGGRPGNQLARDYFSRYRVEFEPSGAVEFHLTHGHWIALLRGAGFVVDRLLELRPQPGAKPRFDVVSPEWAQHWPSEEIWVAHKAW